ncbi:MAG: 30S ribosomal protein S6 [Chthoniobacteraceae bacterium]
MKNRYEALLILDTKGKEDSAKEIIERLEKLLVQEGAVLEQTQRLDQRQFSYTAGKLNHGYYVNFIFEAERGICEKLKAKLDFDETVYRQHYIRLKARKPAEVAAAA